jgi:heme/copper-type cytochrome/quinol oxidase subunit 4
MNETDKTFIGFLLFNIIAGVVGIVCTLKYGMKVKFTILSVLLALSLISLAYAMSMPDSDFKSTSVNNSLNSSIIMALLLAGMYYAEKNGYKTVASACVIFPLGLIIDMNARALYYLTSN